MSNVGKRCLCQVCLRSTTSAQTAVRIINFHSCVEHAARVGELYDLQQDLYELENLLHEPISEAEPTAAGLSVCLDDLRSCEGDLC